MCYAKVLDRGCSIGKPNPQELELMARKLRWKRMQQAQRRGAFKSQSAAETTGGPVKTYQATPEQIAQLLSRRTRSP